MFGDAKFGFGVIYMAHLLDDIDTVKIDCFTKWDRDILTEFEPILQYYCSNILKPPQGLIQHP